MMNKLHYLFYTALLLLAACRSGEGQNTANKLVADTTIVVIFKDAPHQLTTKDGNQTNAEAIYINGISHTPPVKGADTLRITTQATIEEISHVYLISDNIRFPLVAGDTVVFEYDSIRFPYPRSLVNETYTKLYNLRTTNPYYRMQDGYTVYAHVTQQRGFFSKEKDLFDRWQHYAERFKATLDSLSTTEDTLVMRLIDYYRVDLELENLFVEWSRQKPQYVPDNIAFQNYKLKSSLPYLDKIKNSKRLIEFTGLVVQPDWPKKEGDWHPEYAASFMNLVHMTREDSFPREIRKELLSCAKLFVTWGQAADTVIKYNELYIDLTGDTVAIQKLKKYKSSIEVYKDDISLTNLNGDTILFKDLMNQLKGKVVYIDYWASGCAPCRREMPSSNKLREEYKTKDVEFLYFALNDKTDAWKKAVRDDDLSSGKNYIINNSKGAKTLQELQVRTIPRYMIYDKTGKLVVPDAPRPSSTEIRKLLDRVLK